MTESDAGTDYLLPLRDKAGDNRILREAVEAVLAERECGSGRPAANYERFVIVNPKDGETDYLAYDQEQLSEFATDVAHELAFHFVEGTDVEQVEVTLNWRGAY